MVYTNGFFQLNSKDTGVYLRIFPPKNGGKAVDVREIAEYLNRVQISDFDITTINHLLQEDDSVLEVPISTMEADRHFPVDEQMQILISEDGLYAYARFYPPSPGGQLLNTKEIVRILKSEQVVFGIDEYAIRTFLHKREYCRDYMVAHGKNVRQGKDARITYHFDTQRKAKPQLLEDGSVDFHHLDAINHIEKDGLLATLYPEDAGEAGTDVRGNTIPPQKVKRLYLKYGRNIYESEDKTKIFSKIDGHVHLEDGKVIVSDTYQVLADVDTSTGDIDYEGNVSVLGNVRTGFTIRATGDINIKGVVEGANLYAGGEVVVQRGIQGVNKGTIECGGNVYAKFIENSSVKAGGGVVTEAIMHSEVISQADIMVDGKKGLITGGRVCSRSSISVKTAGSDMGTVTKLEVGADPKILEECHLLAKRMPEIQREIDTNQKIVDMYSKKLALGERLPAAKIEALKTAKIAVENSTKEFKMNEERMEQYREQIMADSHGVIRVEKVMYPGVEVMIADVSMHVRKETKYCSLVRDGADIRIRPY